MADQKEIQDAVDTALKYGNGAITLLHCISGYPTPAMEYNLQTMSDMRKRYGVDVGLSDHTLSNITAISAVALGALWWKNMSPWIVMGRPDDSFSLEEDGLKELCSATKMLGKLLEK